MSRRNYSNFAQAGAPASNIASGDTSIDVDTQTDYPDAPYIITVFEGGKTPPAAPKKEVMRATSVTENGDGTFTLDVVRDIDGYNGGGESFTTSATVQHVSIADEVGPKEAIVSTQTVSESDLYLYENFRGPSGGNLGGRTSPTGQTWTSQTGGGEFDVGEGTLEPNAFGGICTVPGAGQDVSHRVRYMIHSTDNFEFSIVFGWTDVDNYFTAALGGASISINEVSGGSSSQIANTSTNNHKMPRAGLKVNVELNPGTGVVSMRAGGLLVTNRNGTNLDCSTLGIKATQGKNQYVSKFAIITP